MEDALRLHFYSIRPVVGIDVTQPIEEELAELYEAQIQSASYDFEPPAAGFTEIAFTAAVTGGVVLLYKVFEPLVTAAGEAFRDSVMNLIRNGRKSKVSGRTYVPLRIELGSDPADPHPNTPVRYYFHGQMDEDGLLLRLRAANEHVRTLPPELFSGSGGPSENGLFWDKEQQRWRGTVWRYRDESYGKFWIPEDLWKDE